MRCPGKLPPAQTCAAPNAPPRQLEQLAAGHECTGAPRHIPRQTNTKAGNPQPTSQATRAAYGTCAPAPASGCRSNQIGARSDRSPQTPPAPARRPARGWWVGVVCWRGGCVRTRARRAPPCAHTLQMTGPPTPRAHRGDNVVEAHCEHPRRGAAKRAVAQVVVAAVAGSLVEPGEELLHKAWGCGMCVWGGWARVCVCGRWGAAPCPPSPPPRPPHHTRTFAPTYRCFPSRPAQPSMTRPRRPPPASRLDGRADGARGA